MSYHQYIDTIKDLEEENRNLKAHAVEVLAKALGYSWECDFNNQIHNEPEIPSREEFCNDWEICTNKAWKEFRDKYRAEAKTLLGWEDKG